MAQQDSSKQGAVFILATSTYGGGERYTGRVVEIDADMERFFKIPKRAKHRSKADALAHYAAMAAAAAKLANSK